MSEKQLEKYDQKKQYPRHEIAYKEGGIHNSKVKSPIASGVFSNLLKQISGKILKGEVSNMMEISKPVKLCSHLCTQEIISIDNIPTEFLDQAAYYSKINNPIKRLQNIAAFIISSIHIVPTQIYTKIPLDPTNLGETHQLHKPGAKTQFSSEVISLSPPVSVAQINSEDLSWKLILHHKLQGQIDIPGMNSMTCSAVGKKYYYFKENDGSTTEITSDNFLLEVEGLLYGERISRPKGSIQIIDKKNKLVCDIKFTYEKKGAMASITKSIGGLFGSKKEKKEEKPVEYFDVVISKVSSFEPGAEKGEDFMKMPVSTGHGNYLEYLQFDGEVFWKQSDQFEQWKPVQNLLKSDLLFRDCRNLLQMEDYDNSEKEKVRCEKEEENDVKLRLQAQQNSIKNGKNVFKPRK